MDNGYRNRISYKIQEQNWIKDTRKDLNTQATELDLDRQETGVELDTQDTEI